MKIRPIDTLNNLKNWPAYDYKDYRLNKDEANNCVAALENYIWHSIDKEGLPTKDGKYLFKLISPDESEIDCNYIIRSVKDGILNISDPLKPHAASWRKIMDYEMED